MHKQMEAIQSLINLLLVLLPIGCGARVTYCLVARSVDEDGEQHYKQRMRNALIFLALGESITGLISVVLGYF